ncbi:MAG TPA: hypothetical protein VFM53_05135 [Anaeromyxobacteraceae bacterium]|nr:hypothetical protein [Anaeromyxobacteraceae bacterium]
MATPPRRPAPRTDPAGPGPRNRLPWLAAAALLVIGIGAWLFLRDGAPSGTGETAPALPADVPPRQITSSEVADPVERRRLAELEERRGRYASLRDAFGDGQPAAPATLARLSPVLGALWPAGTVAWTAACKGQLCRVSAPAPVDAWQAQLAAAPEIARLAEGVAVDPDAKVAAAFLVLLPPGAAQGGSVLDAVAEDFRTSSDIRECLSRVGATGRVEYTVTVDVSGYTYRSDADLPPEALDCADRVLGEILDRHPPPKAVQTASRTLTLRR